MSSEPNFNTKTEGIRPQSPVRPFMKVRLDSLKEGDLFYVRNERGHGYRPRQYVGLGVEEGEYVYKSFLNNDIFDGTYEDPHVDTAQPFVAKSFAMKIMRRAKALAEQIMEEFGNIPNNEVIMSDQLELIKLSAPLQYDEYEVMKQTIRRLGLLDSNLVAKSGTGWLIDYETYQYINKQLTEPVSAPAPSTTVPVVVQDAPQETKAKSSWWKRMVDVVAG